MTPSNDSDSPAIDPLRFATTHWSLVIAAGNEHHSDRRDALSSLCQTYWLPLYAYARRRVANVADAQDLTQAFFAEFLEENYFETASPDRGRFRSYLLTSFQHFLAKEREKQRAQKRGGGRSHLSLDFVTADQTIQIEPADGLTPEQLYDRQWVMALLQQTIERLSYEYQEAGKQQQFDLLKEFLIGGRGNEPYADVARKLQTSEAAARKAASRLRQRYRELLRAAIAETVASPDEIDEEIRSLFVVFE